MLSNVSQFRKAIAAFFVTLIGLPIASWIDGSEVFSVGKLVAGVGAALVAAAVVYLTPNAAPNG